MINQLHRFLSRCVVHFIQFLISYSFSTLSNFVVSVCFVVLSAYYGHFCSLKKALRFKEANQKVHGLEMDLKQTSDDLSDARRGFPRLEKLG